MVKITVRNQASDTAPKFSSLSIKDSFLDFRAQRLWSSWIHSSYNNGFEIMPPLCVKKQNMRDSLILKEYIMGGLSF